jgi:hypothetical protein
MHALFLFGTLPVRLYYFWARASLTTGNGWMIFFPFFRQWLDGIFHESEIERRDTSPGVLEFARASKKGSLRGEFRDTLPIILRLSAENIR